MKKNKQKQIYIPLTGEVIAPFRPIGFPSAYPLLQTVADNAVTVYDRNGHFIRHMGKSALKQYLKTKTYYVWGY